MSKRLWPNFQQIKSFGGALPPPAPPTTDVYWRQRHNRDIQQREVEWSGTQQSVTRAVCGPWNSHDWLEANVTGRGSNRRWFVEQQLVSLLKDQPKRLSFTNQLKILLSFKTFLI